MRCKLSRHGRGVLPLLATGGIDALTEMAVEILPTTPDAEKPLERHQEVLGMVGKKGSRRWLGSRGGLAPAEPWQPRNWGQGRTRPFPRSMSYHGN